VVASFREQICKNQMRQNVGKKKQNSTCFEILYKYHLYAVHDYFKHAGGRDIFLLDWRQVLSYDVSFLNIRIVVNPVVNLVNKGEIHETLQICKSLTKRQIQCFNNVGCHGFEFATPYRALPSFVNDPLRIYPELPYKYVCFISHNYNFTIIVPNAFNYLKNVTTWEQCSVEL
jgi:hypothetical protein